MITCSVPGCERETQKKGMCERHYQRLLKYGDPLGGRTFEGEPRKWIEDHVGHTGVGCLIFPYGRMSNGYGTLTVDGKKTTAHRYICTLVHGPAPSPKHEARHVVCGAGHLGCCHPGHIAWGTPLENQADKVIHGTVRRGEKAANAKLQEHEIYLMRAQSADGWTQRALAKEFGVCQAVVSKIVNGKAWKI